MKRTSTLEETATQKVAHEIMGKNFFGINEATKYLNVRPTNKALSVLATIHYDQALLEECKDTHILTALFPLSIGRIREAAKGKPAFHYRANFQFGYSEGAEEIRWRLIRRTSVIGSRNKKLKEQEQLLGPREYTPTLQVMVYTIIGYFLATNERLFSDELVRTNTRDAYYQMHVGYFRSEGLMMNNNHATKPYFNIGLSSAI